MGHAKRLGQGGRTVSPPYEFEPKKLSMSESQISESPHERRITWSLMAAVVAFIALMTCIVLWVTSSLITHELDQPNPTSAPMTVTPLQPTATPSPVPETPTAVSPTLAVDSTLTVFPTLTPDLGPVRHVRFVIFKVSPSQITLGQCVQVTWEVEYAVSLQLYRNNELLLEDAPTINNFSDCPNLLGYVVYRLEASNRKGESNWIQGQVKVKEAP